MAFRIFRDSGGVEWQTWDVVPRLAERRGRERRADAVARPCVERGRATERRVVSGGRPMLSAGLDCGWLCFAAPLGKRRLSPIPPDWTRCAASRLEEYCRAAKPAVRSEPVNLRDIS